MLWPHRYRVGCDVFVSNFVSLEFLILAHAKRLINRCSHTGRIPWVDMNCTGEHCGCSGKFRQDQRTVVSLLAKYVFQTCRVHAVTNTSNQTNICDTQETKVFKLRNILRIVLHRRKAQRSKSAVNCGNETRNLAANLVLWVLLLLFHTGRTRNLNQDNLITPVRVLFQKCFKSLQFLRNTTDTVQSISADNDLLTCIQFLDVGNDSLDIWRTKSRLLYILRIDSSSKDINRNVGSIGINASRIRLKSEHAGATGWKVSGIWVCLKSYHVRSENSGKHFFPLG